MPLNFEFEFFYPSLPRISVVLRLASGDGYARVGALIDTGAEISIFDVTIAEWLGIDLASGTPVTISGIGGNLEGAQLATVYLELLEEPDLGITLQVAFAPLAGLGLGHLIGLDLLSHFDFGLSHADHVAYIGRHLP